MICFNSNSHDRDMKKCRKGLSKLFTDKLLIKEGYARLRTNSKKKEEDIPGFLVEN